MITIDLLRNDATTIALRVALDKVYVARRATLARYRRTEKHKEQQHRYLSTEKGRAAKNRNQAVRRVASPPKQTEEQRARKNKRSRERAAERYRTDAEYRGRMAAAGKIRNKIPKTPEQRERARAACRESMRRWATNATNEEKEAKYAATRAWRRSLSAEQKKEQHAKDVLRLRGWTKDKYRTDPEWRAEQLSRAKRRRALLMLGSKGTLDATEWSALCREYGCCAYCGRAKRLTQDHVRPLKHRGSHTLENVVPACLSCNARKGALLPAAAFAKLGIDPTSSGRVTKES